MAKTPKRKPAILTSRKYRRVYDQMESLRGQVEDYESLGRYIAIARDLKSAAEASADSRAGQSDVLHTATEQARETFYEEIVHERANSQRVKLSEAEEERLRQEFIASDQARIDKEVAAEVASKEEVTRQHVAHRTEAELKRLGREALLEQIETDEAKKTLERFAALAIKKANHDAMIEELKVKAEHTQGLAIADVPTDTVLAIGLQESKNKRGKTSLAYCDRVLKVRVLEPSEAVFEVMDDSWVASDDSVRRSHALPDLAVLTMAIRNNSLSQPRLSRDVSPNFTDENDQLIPMFGFETQVVAVEGLDGETAIFA